VPIVSYAIIGLLLSMIGFYAIDLTTPGPLRKMVNAGKPNAIIVATAGMISMAFIVVLAIYSSSGALIELTLTDGLLAAGLYGIVGIAVQVLMMRVVTIIIGVDMREQFESNRYMPEVLLIVAAQFALGAFVAVAIL
jgi:hypothetical protein